MMTSEERVTRFWAGAKPVPSGCWEWQRSTRGAGYAQCNEQDHPSRIASRAAWTLTYGAIPEGLWVCHECDNPLCINPKHLFLGTALDNHKDMVAKARNYVLKAEDLPTDTRVARKALADRYKDASWRQEQGERIKAGHLRRKLQNQVNVRAFAFGFNQESPV